MDERQRRVGENEILFRQVNEQIEHLNRQFSVAVGETSEFVCECGRGDCAERIELTRPEYERVRADPTLFALVDGHQDPEVDVVLERGERFTLIRKRSGGPAQLAAEQDPRG